MTDALRVHDLVVGKTGDLQVRQFVQLGTPKPVAVSLEPEQVGEVIECGHVRQMVLRNIHVTQMDVGAQQLDVRQFSRRWKRPWFRVRIQQGLAEMLRQKAIWRWPIMGRRRGDR